MYFNQKWRYNGNCMVPNLMNYTCNDTLIGISVKIRIVVSSLLCKLSYTDLKIYFIFLTR